MANTGTPGVGREVSLFLVCIARRQLFHLLAITVGAAASGWRVDVRHRERCLLGISINEKRVINIAAKKAYKMPRRDMLSAETLMSSPMQIYHSAARRCIVET